MQSVKLLLVLATILAVLGGWVLVADRASSVAVAAEPAGDHWRNFDGHWSYWHEGDKRWYYTDGSHWYYHNGSGWVLYEFNKLFGRGFHHGDYHVPAERGKIVMPKHDVYKHP